MGDPVSTQTLSDLVTGGHAPPANPYDDAAASVMQTQALQIRNNVANASGQNPAQVAQHAQIADALGVPIQSVQADPATAQQRLVMQNFDSQKIVQQFPHLAQFLTNPVNAAKASDDLQTLAATEAAIKALPPAATQDFTQDTPPAPDGLLDDLAVGAKNTILKVFGAWDKAAVALNDAMPDGTLLKFTPEERAGYLARAAALQGPMARASTPQRWTGNVAGGLTYLPFLEAAPAVVAGSEGTAASQQLQDAGVDPATANQTGAVTGAVLGAAQMVPMGNVLFKSGMAPLAKSVAAATTKAGLVGAGQEAVTDTAASHILQANGYGDLADQYAPTMEKAWNSALFMSALHVGSQLATHGAPQLFSSGVPPIPADVVTNTTKAADAARSMDGLQALGELAAQSNLRQNDPQAFHDFVQKVTDSGTLPEVWVNARTFVDGLNQSKIPMDELAAKLPDVAGQLHEALQTGGDVKISTADYVTHLAGEPIGQALLPHLKTDPEGMTFQQGQDTLAQQQNDMTARAQELTAAQPALDARQQQLDDITRNVQAQLEATGRYPADVAKTNAQLHSAWYDAMSDRMGITPEELQGIAPLPDIVAAVHGGDTLSQGEGNRGFFNPVTGELGLLKDADLSTFLHESGHHFLEATHKLAMHPDAPEGIKSDFDTLLQHFGAQGASREERLADWSARDLNAKREGHEKFAGDFESYLMSSKAPVPELQSMFSRFRAWLMNVYRGIRPAVSPEVGAVMDRMFASQEAIHEAERVRAYAAPDLPAEHGPLIDLHKTLGHEATEQAIAEMQARSLRDMKWLANAKNAAIKELQHSARDERAKILAEVTGEVDSLPAYKALADVRATKDHSATNLDMIAESHGYHDHVAMLEDIAAHGKRQDAIAGLVDRRMLERHGDLTDPVSIERAAEAAIHNEARAKMMATGLKMFTKTPMGVLEINRAVKAAADTAINAQKVGDLRPARYSAAEARANRDVLKLAPRDPMGAATAQREALLNNRLFKSASEAVQDIRNGLAYVKRLQSTSALKKVAPAEREQLLNLLRMYDFRKNPDDAPTRAELNLAQWRDSQVAAGNMPSVDPAALATVRTQYRDLPVEHFRGLIDTLRSIEQIGRDANKLDIEGRKVDLREYVDGQLLPKIAERGERYSASEVLDHPENRGIGGMRAGLDKLSSWMNRAHEMSLDPVHRMEMLDRHEVLGPFAKAIFNPMFDAGVREARLTKNVSDMAREGAASLGREWQESRMDVVPNRVLLDAQASRQEGRAVYLRITRDNLVGMLVHSGNESNFDRLVKGREWDPATVTKFINDNITAKDLEAANRLWKMAGTHWDEQVAQAQRLGAILPPKIEAREFDTPVGKATGGYAPIRYDPLRSRQGARAEQATEVNAHEAMRSAASYGDRQSTVAGSLNARKDGYVDVIDLRLSRLEEAIREDMHDLAFRETILNTNKILNDGQFRTAFLKAYGREEYKALTGWVNHFVNSAQTDKAVDALDAALRYTRQGVVANAIGFRASTAEKHGMGAALKSVGYFIGGGEKFFAKRLAAMATDYTNQTDSAVKKFPEIYTRALQFDRDYRATVGSMLDPESFNSKAHRYGHWLVAKLDLFTAVPTAWAAYDRAITEGIPVSQGGTGQPMTDAQAVAYASNLVRSAHGGSTDATRSNLMNSNSEAVKLFTMMYSFMNNSYGQGASIIDKLKQQGIKGTPEALARATLLFGAPAIAAAVVKGGLPKKDDLGKWLEHASLEEAVSMIPGGSQFMQLVQSARGAGETPTSAWEQSVVQPVKDAVAVAHGQAPARPIQDIGNAIGNAFHLSGSGQLGTTLQYLHDVATHKEHPTGVLDFLHGVAQGPHKAVQ